MDAKWIYDNCNVGTKITIYESKNPGPLGKPKAIKVKNRGAYWDPTDPSSKNPYFIMPRPVIKVSATKMKYLQYGKDYNFLYKVTAKDPNTFMSLTKYVKVKAVYKWSTTRNKYLKVSMLDNKSFGTYSIKYYVKDPYGRSNYAFHKVKVVFWQTDAHDQPATVTEPYEKAFTAANLKKEQEFHDSDITFRVRVKAQGQEKTITIALKPADSATKKLKAALGDSATLWPEILSVEWTHRHYVADDEYIPHGEDIAAFLKREIAKPIIRWEDSPQLGYEILPNKYFYRYQPPTPAKDLLAEFWRLEKEAEKMLEGLAK